MSDFSLAIVVGKLTRDPELKYSASGGVPFTTLTLAVNRNSTQPDGSVKKSVTIIDVTAWRHQAELCAQFLTRGSTAMIVGSLQQQRSTDEEGRSRSHVQIVADRVQFLDRRVASPAPATEADGENSTETA